MTEEISKNYFEVGAKRLIIGGTIDRAGAPKNLTGLGAQLLQRYKIAPALHTAVYVHAAINLLAAAQDIKTGITNPDVPRIVTIKGGIAGQAGNVVITGTNILGATITDTIALNGTGEVLGVNAFKTVTNIHVPAQTHTATAQVETATVVGTVTEAGNAKAVVTAAGMAGSPKTYEVPVAYNNSAAIVAGKMRTILAADAVLTAMFNVGGTGATVVLTAVAPAANDATLNIATDNDTCTGLTTEATSVNTTAGVAYDTVTVGIGSLIGMPHILEYTSMLLLALFNGAADTGGSLALNAAIEKNLYTAAGTFDGSKLLELFYLV